MKSLRPSMHLSAVICVMFLSLITYCLWSFPASSSSCNYIWTSQTSGTTALLSSVKAVSESICWVGGSNTTIRRTTDGGSTWVNGNPSPGVITGNITNIEALDADNAWVSTVQSTMTFMYKTTNGGNGWVQVYSQTGGYLFGIHMNSASNGIAFGDPIAGVWRLLVTADGGSTWSPLPTSPPAASSASQGSRNCFQVSPPYIWFGSYPGQILRSTNNGATWTVHNTPGIATVLSVHFNSPALGFASSTTMVGSIDTGSTYQQLSVLGSGNINGIEGSGNEIWYIRGEYVYRSINSGVNWTLMYNAAVTQQAIDFPDNLSGCLTGWSVGNAGIITKMTGIPLGINNNGEIPQTYVLHQNYPNPFNPETSISYSLPETGNVILKVYDATGKEVASLINGYRQAGTHRISFDATHLSSGMYIYRLTSGTFTGTKKMIIMK